MKCTVHSLVSLLLAWLLSATALAAEPDLDLFFSAGGDDFRTRKVREYFEHLGREFGVYRLSLQPGETHEPAIKINTHGLDRQIAGNKRYNALKVSDALFYHSIAESVNEHFAPLPDDVNNDASGVTATEWLQRLFRQAHALERSGADLSEVEQRVTVTYAWDGRNLVVAPTTFNYRDHARNAEGSELHKNFGVNGFSKHYFLARILNADAEVAMAGKMYIRVMSLDPDVPADLTHVFREGQDVDLSAYDFELTVTNESGTFKPLADDLPYFAQVLVDALELGFIHWRAHGTSGQISARGTVNPSQH